MCVYLYIINIHSYQYIYIYISIYICRERDAYKRNIDKYIVVHVGVRRRIWAYIIIKQVVHKHDMHSWSSHASFFPFYFMFLIKNIKALPPHTLAESLIYI